ncbi:hypothetical protein ER57_11230 [Smithella sp. SCADC]|jgi:hypothetical protein|nr:hypothetical protein ER57_11230 [Smithella sp. SCADC]
MTVNENILSLTAALNSGGLVSGKTPAWHNADWPTMIAALEKTGMAGYFSVLFSKTEAGLKIPAADFDTLKKTARRIAAYNALYESECAELLKGLSAMGVKSILLKGLSYMEDIYGDTSARGMSDIDLLIRPDDRMKALDYLLSDGYSGYVIPSFKGSKDDFAKLTDITGESHFIKQSGVLTVGIDLHWKMRAGYPLNDYLLLDRFPWWEQTGMVVIGGATARRLSPEMQFIHLALHFAIHHQYTGLRWFIELCLFIKRYKSDLDWEFIYKTSASPDCRKLLGVCLRLAADYMGNSSPGPAVWRRFLPENALLPGEYRFYKSCLMRETRSRFASYICMTLSPATLAGRFGIISYFMFDPQGVMFWSGSDKRVPKLLQPFYNFYLIGSQLLRGRRAR